MNFATFSLSVIVILSFFDTFTYTCPSKTAKLFFLGSRKCISSFESLGTTCGPAPLLNGAINVITKPLILGFKIGPPVLRA